MVYRVGSIRWDPKKQAYHSYRRGYIKYDPERQKYIRRSYKGKEVESYSSRQFKEMVGKDVAWQGRHQAERLKEKSLERGIVSDQQVAAQVKQEVVQTQVQHIRRQQIQRVKQDVARTEQRKQIFYLTGGHPAGSVEGREFMKKPLVERQTIIRTGVEIQTQKPQAQQPQGSFFSRQLSKLSSEPEIRKKGAVAFHEERIAKEEPFKQKSFFDIFRKDPDKPFLLEPEGVGIERGITRFAVKRPILTATLPAIGFGLGAGTTALGAIPKLAVPLKVAEIGVVGVASGFTLKEIITAPGKTSVERRIKRGEIIGKTGLIVGGLAVGAAAGTQKTSQFLARRSISGAKITRVKTGEGRIFETGTQVTKFKVGRKYYQAVTETKTILTPKARTIKIIKTDVGKLQVSYPKPAYRTISQSKVTITATGKTARPIKPQVFQYRAVGQTTPRTARFDFQLSKPGLKLRLFETGKLALKTRRLEGGTIQVSGLEIPISPRSTPRGKLFFIKKTSQAPFIITKEVSGIQISKITPFTEEKFIAVGKGATPKMSRFLKPFLAKKGQIFLSQGKLQPPLQVAPPPSPLPYKPSISITPQFATRGAITAFIGGESKIGMFPLIGAFTSEKKPSVPFIERKIPKPSTIPKPRVDIIPDLKPDVGIKPRPTGGIRPDLGTKPVSKPTQTPTQIPIIEPIQEPITRPLPSPPPSPAPPSFTSAPLIPSIPPLGLPFKSKPYRKLKRPKRRKFKQPKLYSPTLYSVFGKIKASKGFEAKLKKKKKKRITFTGLEIRPILRGLKNDWG